jgi:hypothetical protein
MDRLLLPGGCQYDGCTHRVNSNDSGRFCFTHGGWHVCSHASCLNFAQAGGRCIKHGYKKPTCSVDGCSNQSIVCGLCKRHGAHRSCNVINCTNHVFNQSMCRFHYSSTNETITVTNKSITVLTTTNFITESGTVTTNLFTPTNKSSTVMEIDIVIQEVMEFVGMGNWEQVHTFAAVCKFWRQSSLPHLYNIGKVPMDGGAERRLNVAAFLRFLQSEHFINMQCILVPCGKTKGLFVNEIKQACPSVQTIVHSKWLMIDELMEEIQEREGRHPCYRVYRHDKPFTEGTKYGLNLTGTKSANLFWNHCLYNLLSYDSGIG